MRGRVMRLLRGVWWLMCNDIDDAVNKEIRARVDNIQASDNGLKWDAILDKAVNRYVAITGVCRDGYESDRKVLRGYLKSDWEMDKPSIKSKYHGCVRVSCSGNEEDYFGSLGGRCYYIKKNSITHITIIDKQDYKL